MKRIFKKISLLPILAVILWVTASCGTAGSGSSNSGENSSGGEQISASDPSANDTSTDDTTLQLSEKSIALSVGEEYTIRCETNGDVTFRSADETIASVDKDGKVSARAEGVTQITVQAGQKVTAVTVRVKASATKETIGWARLAGEGKKDSPYLISSADDLTVLRDEVLDYEDTAGVYFKQTQDIKLESENWTPVGLYGIPFEGVYDGDGHSISALKIDTDQSFQGLFGVVTGTVENLNVYGTVSVHLDAHYSHSYVGGIVGAIYNQAYIYNCNSYVAVSGDSYVGGVVGAIQYTDDFLLGENLYSTVEKCTYYGELIANDDSAKNENAMYFGGVVGRNDGIVKNCVNRGKVQVSGEKAYYVGGVVGYAYNTDKNLPLNESDLDQTAMDGCENYGTVSGSFGVGGIVGQTSHKTVRCSNYGEVSGNNCVGGIVGISGTSGTASYGYATTEECKNFGRVSGFTRHGGGIVGWAYNAVKSCENSAEVVGEASSERAGGIAGYSQTDITDCVNQADGRVTAQKSVGGIVGWLQQNGVSVKNAINYGEIATITQDESAIHIGGIVGMLGSANSVLSCDNYGNITGGGHNGSASTKGGTGGVVGSMYSGSVVDGAKNYGYVKAIARLGGVVGFGYANTQLLYIQNCENSGTVESTLQSGSAYLGGLVGSVAGGTIQGCKNKASIVYANGVKGVSETIGYSKDMTIENVVSEVQA